MGVDGRAIGSVGEVVTYRVKRVTYPTDDSIAAEFDDRFADRRLLQDRIDLGKHSQVVRRVGIQSAPLRLVRSSFIRRITHSR
jgi:hypothetical protein